MRVEGNCYVGVCDCCGDEKVLSKVMPVYSYSYVYVCAFCIFELMEKMK